MYVIILINTLYLHLYGSVNALTLYCDQCCLPITGCNDCLVSRYICRISQLGEGLSDVRHVQHAYHSQQYKLLAVSSRQFSNSSSVNNVIIQLPVILIYSYPVTVTLSQLNQLRLLGLT